MSIVDREALVPYTETLPLAELEAIILARDSLYRWHDNMTGEGFWKGELHDSAALGDLTFGEAKKVDKIDIHGSQPVETDNGTSLAA